jgi:hypothetical protein
MGKLSEPQLREYDQAGAITAAKVVRTAEGFSCHQRELEGGRLNRLESTQQTTRMAERRSPDRAPRTRRAKHQAL